MRIRALPLLAALAPLALAACGQAEEPTYEAGATDESGGEFIVNDADATGVPVQLPETEMTPVPDESGVPMDDSTPEPPAAE